MKFAIHIARRDETKRLIEDAPDASTAIFRAGIVLGGGSDWVVTGVTVIKKPPIDALRRVMDSAARDLQIVKTDYEGEPRSGRYWDPAIARAEEKLRTATEAWLQANIS